MWIHLAAQWSAAADSFQLMALNNAENRQLATLLMYDGMGLLDFGGPYEVLHTANRLCERAGENPPFEIVTASPTGDAVTADGGVVVTPHCAAKDVRNAALVIVPGTVDLKSAGSDKHLAAAVQHLSSAEIMASVCTGAFLLGDAGLLTGRPWTTHQESIPALRDRLAAAGETEFHPRAATSARVLDDDTVITAGGFTCGMDLTLNLVSRLASADLAKLVAEHLEFSWSD